MDRGPTSIHRMPPELTQKIFSYLPDDDLVNCAFHVCRRWKEIATCTKLWGTRKLCVRDKNLGSQLSDLLWNTALLRFFCVKKASAFRAKYSGGNLVVNNGPVNSSADLSLAQFKACAFMSHVKSVKMEDDILVMCLGDPEDRPTPRKEIVCKPKNVTAHKSCNVKPEEHKNCLFEGSVSGSKVGDVVVVTRLGPPEQSVYNPGPAPPKAPEVHKKDESGPKEKPKYCGFGDEALATVFSCCPALESLDLWGLQLSDNTLQLLALCRQLTAFRLAKCTGVTSLGSLARCRKLSHLTVDTCPDLGAAALRQLAQMPSLESIELYECDMSGFPFAQIVPGLPLLSSITIVNCKGFSQKDLSLFDREDLDLTIEFAQNAADP
ncbi:uncharacterized protein LOC126476178 [Schistocerca serialis cubense]|uniref:uncharacterized protein LOC126476178 n=1 Tax=Schistocerca serialis cubense TaxID=2023355 RepID=UPI00214E32B1|nr:uncharacterized protein LOC126476178 [Schistocerca serialis cubense]